MASPATTPRLVLAIETSNPSSWTEDTPVMPGVALAFLDAPAIPIARAHCDPRLRDESLVLAIDAAFTAAGAAPSQLARIAVSIGPGGFTALRVAVTVAKTLALSTHAQIVAVPSAHIAARHAAHTRPAPGIFAVALASKADDTWLTTFHSDASPLHTGRLVTAADLPQLGLTRLVADHHLPGSIRDKAAELGLPIEPPTFDATDCLAAAVHLPPTDALHLNLLYARIPEAIRKWRELHGEHAAPWPS